MMNLVCQTINALANKQRREFESFRFPGPVGPSQVRILHFLLTSEKEEIYQKDIEEEFQLRAPSATFLLNGMKKNGLIERHVSNEDARRKQILLTKTGREHSDGVMSAMKDLESRLLKGIDQKDLEVWDRVSMQMLNNL